MINFTSWTYLGTAILAEVAGTTAMKLSAGFTHLQPSLLIFCFYGLSLAFLALSLKDLEIGLAYAIWSGLGTALIFILGICFFNEPFTLFKILSAISIIIGVVGLKQA